MGIRSWSTNTLFQRSCRANRCNCSIPWTRWAKRPEVTEFRTPGEERLLQLAEPEKEVAAGTNTLVVGPYLTRKWRLGGPRRQEEEGANPRPSDARLDEAAGLAA